MSLLLLLLLLPETLTTPLHATGTGLLPSRHRPQPQTPSFLFSSSTSQSMRPSIEQQHAHSTCERSILCLQEIKDHESLRPLHLQTDCVYITQHTNSQHHKSPSAHNHISNQKLTMAAGSFVPPEFKNVTMSERGDVWICGGTHTGPDVPLLPDVESPTWAFRTCSRTVASCSPVFADMLFDDDGCPRTFQLYHESMIHLPDDDVGALDVVLRLAHGAHWDKFGGVGLLRTDDDD